MVQQLREYTALSEDWATHNSYGNPNPLHTSKGTYTLVHIPYTDPLMQN